MRPESLAEMFVGDDFFKDIVILLMGRLNKPPGFLFTPPSMAGRRNRS
jgi:hypothetical protein